MSDNLVLAQHRPHHHDHHPRHDPYGRGPYYPRPIPVPVPGPVFPRRGYDTETFTIYGSPFRLNEVARRLEREDRRFGGMLDVQTYNFGGSMQIRLSGEFHVVQRVKMGVLSHQFGMNDGIDKARPALAKAPATSFEAGLAPKSRLG